MAPWSWEVETGTKDYEQLCCLFSKFYETRVDDNLVEEWFIFCKVYIQKKKEAKNKNDSSDNKSTRFKTNTKKSGGQNKFLGFEIDTRVMQSWTDSRNGLSVTVSGSPPERRIENSF